MPIFSETESIFALIHTFLPDLLGADNNSNIRRSVQRSYWCKSLHYSAAVSKRLISSDTWFKSIGKGTTVHCCNLLIFCFFISCHKRNTQKKVYRFPVDKNTMNWKHSREIFCFVLSPRQCWLNYIICGKHRMFSITVSSLGLSSFKYLEWILVIFVSSPASWGLSSFKAWDANSSSPPQLLTEYHFLKAWMHKSEVI